MNMKHEIKLSNDKNSLLPSIKSNMDILEKYKSGPATPNNYKLNNYVNSY